MNLPDTMLWALGADVSSTAFSTFFLIGSFLPTLQTISSENFCWTTSQANQAECSSFSSPHSPSKATQAGFLILQSFCSLLTLTSSIA